jgi:hypothetical protein
MRRLIFSFKFVCAIFALPFFHGMSQPSENILVQNKILLKNLCQFSSVYDAGSDLGIAYIVFKTEKTERAVNLGYGAAFKTNANIIVPADTAFGYGIEVKNKYLIFRKGVKSTYRNLQNVYSHFKYGMYDNSGQLVLDFNYDYIGKVAVPLPDSMMLVAKGKTFQIFNTEKAQLRSKLYKINPCMYDGYGFHEGGANACKSQIYKQLNLNHFEANIQFIETNNDEVLIHKDSIGAYLASKDGQQISKIYRFIEPLRLCKKEMYFVGALTLNPHSYALLDVNGKEVSLMDTYMPNYNESYIELERYGRYYFIETKQSVPIPEGYLPFCMCYANIGFLGFKHIDTKEKLFIDKFGNQIKEDEL